MDIYGFINSKDVAEHLKSLNYKFTLPEAAFLVYQSRDRMWEEKCAAWRELIDTMPDCSMEERLNLEPIESFHQFLRDYMALQEKILRMFYDSDGAFYTYDIYQKYWVGVKTWTSDTEFEDTNIHRIEQGNYFADAESALAHFKKEYEKEEDRPQWVRFLKKPLLREPDLERNGEIWVEMTPDLEVISMGTYGFGILSNEESTLDMQFDGMWFAFPTPFKRGDILIDVCSGNYYGGGPFVLDTLKSWDAATLMENGFSEQSPMVKHRDETIKRLSGEADSSDMDYYGVFLSSDGKGFPTVCHDVFWSYLDLERYEGPLRGMDRLLKPISSAMTYDPEYCEPSLEPELLCSAYHLILMEQLCKLNRCWLETDYTKEGQELAGLKERT